MGVAGRAHRFRFVVVKPESSSVPPVNRSRIASCTYDSDFNVVSRSSLLRAAVQHLRRVSGFHFEGGAPRFDQEDRQPGKQGRVKRQKPGSDAGLPIRIRASHRLSILASAVVAVARTELESVANLFAASSPMAMPWVYSRELCWASN
jgi:hypothetical protein